MMTTTSAKKYVRRVDEDVLRSFRKLLETAVTRTYFEEVAEGRATPAGARKSATESASRTLEISEGVMELHRSGSFEASVQTEEGRKSLAGAVRHDLQSGPVEQWKSAARDIEAAIRCAYENLAPDKALAAISSIRDELDRLSELAAARAHLTMGKLPGPELAELPSWFDKGISDLADTEEPDAVPSPAVVESAERLVRALGARTGNKSTCEAILDVGPLGRLIIDWLIPTGRLQWMVEASDLPWPTVRVYRLARGCGRDAGGRVARTRILHNAFDAMADFTDHVPNE